MARQALHCIQGYAEGRHKLRLLASRRTKGRSGLAVACIWMFDSRLVLIAVSYTESFDGSMRVVFNPAASGKWEAWAKVGPSLSGSEFTPDQQRDDRPSGFDDIGE